MTDPFGEINASYTSLFEEFGDSANSVMIPKDNQELRFRSIANHISKEETLSYLDYGSGLGHQYSFFVQNGYNRIRYHGVEINSDFIEFSTAKYDGARFLSHKNFHQSKQTYDVTGAIGTFNLLYRTDQDPWDFVRSEIEFLWEKTNKSMFINFMSTSVDYVQPGAYHQDLGVLYNYVTQNLTRKISIDSSYLPYEFTLVACRKENCVHTS